MKKRNDMTLKNFAAKFPSYVVLTARERVHVVTWRHVFHVCIQYRKEERGGMGKQDRGLLAALAALSR